MPRQTESTATGEILVRTPPGFDFLSTVYSHGWYSLPPFSVHKQDELVRVLCLPGGFILRCMITDGGGRLRVNYEAPAPLSDQGRRVLRGCVVDMFRLDEDLTEFHRSAGRSPQHRWITRLGGGRLLRAPTVFEDMVKTICTTNCTWSLTTIMVRNLVGSLGGSSRDGWRSFPDPQALAETSERFLRNEVKAGYRSPYLLELAERVAGGRLDPEKWRTTGRPGEEILKELLAIKGIGPYAAQNLLRLLGHYDFLALDSWVRSKYYSLYHKGRPVKDRTIEANYARYGRWRGLIFWMEMTRDWHDEKFARGLRDRSC